MKIISNLLEKETNINFLRQRKAAFAIAIILIVASIASYAVRGMNYGIDFKGGILIEASSAEPFDMSQVRSEIGAIDNIGDLSIQSAGSEGKMLMIRVLTAEDEAVQRKVIAEIKSVLGDGIEYDRVEMVGPQVGEDLKFDSLLAAAIAVMLIAGYIWFRFELPFAMGAFVSTVHDVVVVFGMFSIFQWDFNLTIVAAIMTVAGYSINDTVVSYDRMRENIRKYRKMTVDELINKSTNDTLSRTILTGTTTLMALVVIYFVGGAQLQGFALAMIIGVVVGTFSSIYIAMPVLRYFDVKNMGEEKVVQPKFNQT